MASRYVLMLCAMFQNCLLGASALNATCVDSICLERPTVQDSALLQFQLARSNVAFHADRDASVDGASGHAADFKAKAIQKRMPAASSSNRISQSGCPHLEQGLSDFKELQLAGDVNILSGNYIIQESAEIGALTISRGATLIFADVQDLMLTATSITVRGQLLFGSSTCPLQSHGVGVTFKTGGNGKGIVVESSGILDVYGKPFAPTWTRLAESVNSGESALVLQDDVDWEVGQQVVVVTTSWRDDPDNHQNEERSIASVNGNTVTLSEPLDFGHYAGVEYAAEVALLSRSITFQGDDASETTRIGGHTMCHAGSRCRISSVRAFRMGQLNVMGRYPFHLHMMGDVSGESFFEDCVVQHSFFRAYTIHGTSDARVSRNVAYDIYGSAYYLEDGIEEHNTFEYNLAALINIIKQLSDYDNGGGQEGVEIQTEDGRILPTDASAVGFYCTNANNRWIGNSASGGFAGFHFPQVPKALGASYALNPSYEPEAHSLLEFDSNTAHSSGRHWKTHGACIYVGGRLWEESPGSHQYSYRTGRYQPARLSGNFSFTNTKVFACNKGVLWWGTYWTAEKPDLKLEGFEAHDVQRSSSMLGMTYMVGAVISGRSGNQLANDMPIVTEAFELYDTDMQTILADVTFRGLRRQSDVAIMDMTHSNIFKMQGMFATKNLRFEDVPEENRYRHVHRLACKTYHWDTCQKNCGVCTGLSGSSQMSNIVDADGTGVGWSKGPAILGSDDDETETEGKTHEWWLLGDDCEHQLSWGFYVCPTHGHREVVSLYLVKGRFESNIPSALFGSRYATSDVVEGSLHHFGHPERRIQLGLAGSPMITGPCCDIGWYMYLEGGALTDLTIYLDQMVPEGGLMFATSYPSDAVLDVKRCRGGRGCTTVAQASSLQQVRDDPGTKFFVDDQKRLFLNLVHEDNTYFEAGGVKQLMNSNRWDGGQGMRYLIRSTRGGVVKYNPPPALEGTTVSPTTSSSPTKAPNSLPITKPTPQPSPAADVEECANSGGNCRSAMCCNDAAMKCYEKNQYWAGCKSSCVPGIDQNDPEEYQTPWTCNLLSSSPTPTGLPTLVPTAAVPTQFPTVLPTLSPTREPSTPPPAPTLQPSPAVDVEVCANSGEDCRSAMCCNDAAMKCYEKDQYWAGCKTSCVPGIDQNDPKEYQTPWTCNLLSSSPTPTGLPTLVPTAAVPTQFPTVLPTLSPTREPSTPPPAPTPQPSPAVDVEVCANSGENCRSAMCCNDAAMKCYEKDQYWAGCKSSCVPGIDQNDPEEYQTPWTCNLLSSSPTPAGFQTPLPTAVPTEFPTQSSTSTPSMAAPPASPDTSNCGDIWDKCGGKNFNGRTCCKGDNICKYSNPWYSQCRPA